MSKELNINLLDNSNEMYDSNIFQIPRNVKIPFLTYEENGPNDSNENDIQADEVENSNHENNKNNNNNNNINNSNTNNNNSNSSVPIFDLNKIFEINFSYNFELLKSLLETLIRNQQENQKELLLMKKQNEIKINEIERNIVDMKISISNAQPQLLMELQKEKEKLQLESKKIQNKVIKEKVLEMKEKDEANNRILNELAKKINEINSKVTNVIPNMEKNMQKYDNYDNDIKKVEIKLADIEGNIQSLSKITSDHDDELKNTRKKIKDLSILELFKDIDDNSEKGNNKNNSIILALMENLDKKYDSKLKSTDEKILNIEQSSFKMSNEIMNIRNMQDLNKRNIETNKKTNEEIYIKLKNLEQKINSDINQINDKNRSFENILNNNMNNNSYIEKDIENNISQNENDINEQKNLNNNKEKISNNININNNIRFNNELKEEIYKNLNDKIREIYKKISDIEKNIKFLPNQAWVENIKNEINLFKENKNKNKYVFESDLIEINNKNEELKKNINILKQQYEDISNNQNLGFNEEINSLKKKFELFSYKIKEIEENNEEIKTKYIQNINNKIIQNENNKKLLQTKKFEEFKAQMIKEFTNANDNFTHLRKLVDDILNSIKNKSSFKDLKSLEDEMNIKLEELKLSSTKKFADRIETIKNIKYIDQQIKHIVKVYIKKLEKNDNWLLAKKPINGNLCASCESYIGDLKDSNPYIPWNKYPFQNQGDKVYRLGNGFSKMLQLFQVEENDKKNVNTNTYNPNINNSSYNNNEFNEVVKNMKAEKSDIDISSMEISSPNKTMTVNNWIKSPQNNLPKLKRGILIKNKSGINLYETINNYNTINGVLNNRNYKKGICLSSSGSMDNINYDVENKKNKVEFLPDEDELITSPKITKIKKIIKNE